MEGILKLLLYQPERDHDAVIKMLSKESFALEQFLTREKQGCDIMWIGCHHGEIVGVLSHGSRYKRTKFVEYITPKYRNHGFGTLLFQKAEEYFSQNEWTERVLCTFPGEDTLTERFLRKQGFYRYCTLYDMEYSGVQLPEASYTIRSYEDIDFNAYNDLANSAFWIMRNKVGMSPNYYQSLGESDRTYMKEHAQDCFVLLEDKMVVAIAKIGGNELSVLAVRPDKQNKGFGRLLASHSINEIRSRGNERVTLKCVEGNPAYNLYRSLGFQVVGKQHEYIKYYLPESRPASHEYLTTEEAFIQQFREYGRL